MANSESKNAYERERLAAKTAAGICRGCQEPVLPGRVLCAVHLGEQRDRRARKYNGRKARGVCVEPTCEAAPIAGHVRCGPCVEKVKAYFRSYTRKVR